MRDTKNTANWDIYLLPGLFICYPGSNRIL